jgi:hypothetical protein
MITKDLPFSVHLTSYSALSSNNLPVLINTIWHSHFQHQLDCPDFWRTEWVNFQTHLEAEILFKLELYTNMAIDTCVEDFSSTVLKALAASTAKSHSRDNPQPLISSGIQN